MLAVGSHLLLPAMLVVAVVAHALGVIGLVRMLAVGNHFRHLIGIYFLDVLENRQGKLVPLHAMHLHHHGLLVHEFLKLLLLLSDFLIHLGKLKLVWVQCATVSLRGSVHAKVKLHNGKFILVTDVTFCVALIILVKFKINLWQLWQHICVSKHCAEVISLL